LEEEKECSVCGKKEHTFKRRNVELCANCFDDLFPDEYHELCEKE